VRFIYIYKQLGQRIRHAIYYYHVGTYVATEWNMVLYTYEQLIKLVNGKNTLNTNRYKKKYAFILSSWPESRILKILKNQDEHISAQIIWIFEEILSEQLEIGSIVSVYSQIIGLSSRGPYLYNKLYLIFLIFTPYKYSLIAIYARHNIHIYIL